MGRYLPLLAIVIVAFAAGAWWRQFRHGRDAQAAPGEPQEAYGGFGVLLWVPVGAAVALVFITALMSLLDQ